MVIPLVHSLGGGVDIERLSGKRNRRRQHKDSCFHQNGSKLHNLGCETQSRGRHMFPPLKNSAPSLRFAQGWRVKSLVFQSGSPEKWPTVSFQICKTTYRSVVTRVRNPN